MGVKRHGNGCTVNGIGLFNDFMKQGLMSDMNPIKVADGDHRIFKRLCNIFETIDNFHKRLASNKFYDQSGYDLDMHSKKRYLKQPLSADYIH